MSPQQDGTDIKTKPVDVPDWLMPLIRCPVTGTPLSKADPVVLNQLQAQAKLGTLRFKNGVSVSEIPSQGLLGGDGRWFYPVQDGIPTLIPDEAVEITGVTGK